jgi:uncharacterized protein
MRVVTDFPHNVRVIEHDWITMSDGCRLAAKLWIPEDAAVRGVPAILEYIPYRKNEATAYRDHSMHAYFAGNGYASARVDLRGSGDSEGILADEYLPLEQQDGIEVIRWLAAQPFCSGKVAMIGISWGGFNSLQIAAHAPPELAAVVSVCSTDDRYRDDIHYMGGAVMASALDWATVMLGYNARPPDPEVVGDEWRRTWFERMEKTPPFIEEWMRHQRRDDFWKQGSVCEDYSAIACPVYMVGGWQDGYRNAILRFLEHHPGPCKGLIGPWGHRYPQEGAPGPAIGFLQECVRFFDHTLNGVDNGIMDEPKLRMFLQDPMRPTPESVDRTGRWLAEPGWPTSTVSPVRFYPTSSGTLAHGAGEPAKLLVPNDETVGLDAGEWCGYGGPLDNPSDQRREDGLSLCFTSEPLASELEILGFPVARLELSADQRYGKVAVRLCHLWPDGASTLITRGVLNLTHRESHEFPEDLEPHRRYLVEVAMNAIAYRVPEGHRIRLAVSPGYWPMMWPSPGPLALTLYTGASTELDVPVYAGPAGQAPLPPHFSEPERAPYLAHEVLALPDAPPASRLTRDLASGFSELVTGNRDRHVRLLESGLEYSEIDRFTFRVKQGDALSAFVRCEQRNTVSRGTWRTRVEATSTLSATAEEFQVTSLLDAFENDRRVFAKTWRFAVARDHT